MLTSLGSDAQRAFLEKAFASAGALASSAARYSANAGLKPAADEVFAYLFGTDQIAIKRSAVTRKILTGKNTPRSFRLNHV